jgi:hypothetical protein
MKRRHLFDNGFPVTTATKLAGSAVLLAVANQSLRLSKRRLALSCTRLADTIARVRSSQRACVYTRLQIHATTQRPDRAVEARGADQPRERTTGQTAHQP